MRLRFSNEVRKQRRRKETKGGTAVSQKEKP
jgi:hypothetical protein